MIDVVTRLVVESVTVCGQRAEGVQVGQEVGVAGGQLAHGGHKEDGSEHLLETKQINLDSCFTRWKYMTKLK